DNVGIEHRAFAIHVRDSRGNGFAMLAEGIEPAGLPFAEAVAARWQADRKDQEDQPPPSERPDKPFDTRIRQDVAVRVRRISSSGGGPSSGFAAHVSSPKPQYRVALRMYEWSGTTTIARAISTAIPATIGTGTTLTYA